MLRVFGCGNAWSTKNKRSYFIYCPPKTRDDRYSEYTLRIFGCGDARREATLFAVHQKQENTQRIHAPCIRVRGRAEKSYFPYCLPKTRDRHSEYTPRVFGCGNARREATVMYPRALSCIQLIRVLVDSKQNVSARVAVQVLVDSK